MWERGLVFSCLLLLFSGCSQDKKDAGIKETLASTAKQEVAFASVSYVVKDGVVTLTGNTPSESDRRKVEEKAKSVSGVKEVVNQVVAGPVVLDGDRSLKQSVDSVLKKYPTVMATVQDSVIVLQGNIESKKAQKLFNALERLKAKGVTNQLVINESEREL